MGAKGFFEQLSGRSDLTIAFSGLRVSKLLKGDEVKYLPSKPACNSERERQALKRIPVKTQMWRRVEVG